MKQLLNISSELLKSFKIADWGYTEELVPKSYHHFSDWVNDESHGPLNYLSDHRKKLRVNLKSVFAECESSLVFLFDYTETKKSLEQLNPQNKIASYTLGFDDEDYHYWIAQKLNSIGEELSADIPELEFKLSLDIHPVLERDLAYRAGLGWFGKNSMLINRDVGSYTLIGSLLLNQKLEIDSRDLEVDHCGSCTKCIDACPTNAIDTSSRTLEASKCISTYTIELFKDSPPPVGYPTKSDEMFGCDICQEVCPWNIKPLERAHGLSFSADSLIQFFNREKSEILNDLREMSNKSYKRFFKGTSFERLGKKGLVKNLEKY